MNTIIEKKIETKSILLNKIQTEAFLQSIDKAMHLFDFIEIYKLILDFHLTDASDIDDFLNQAKLITKVSDKYQTNVKNVTTFNTKCVACSFARVFRGTKFRA